MLRTILFLALTIGGLLFAVIGLRAIEPWCSLPEPKFSPDREQYQGQTGSGDRKSADQNARAPKPHFGALYLIETETQTPESGGQNSQNPWYSLGWWKKFFCEMKIGDAAVAYFTYCLVVVGAFQAWGQSEETRTIQRAYIAVVPLGLQQFHWAGNDADEPIACDVGFKNVGHLAARSVKYAIRYKFSPDAGLADFPITGSLDGNIVIPPGIQIRKGASPPIPLAEFDEQVDAELPASRWLYAFGRVEYRDGFGKHRWINFCFRYSLAAAKGSRISKDDARYHEHGNHTDED
jgi:hypothetical protein